MVEVVKVSVLLKPLLKRVAIFFVLFLLFSGAAGSWVVGSRLLNEGNFWIYGNLGKLGILLLVFLILRVKDRIAEVPVLPRCWLDNVLVGVSLVSLVGFFVVGQMLLSSSHFAIGWLLLCHALLVLSPLALFVGVYGIASCNKFWHVFKRDVVYCFALVPFLYVGIFEVWKLWPYLSGTVLKVVNWLLSLTFTTRVIPPYTLIVNNFGIEVAQACSGLDSLFMFSVLYWLLVVSEGKKINIKRAAVAFGPLLAGLYMLNIVRVYVLVLIGVLWSPEIAVHLFHTYAGMILFITYFFLFLYAIYPKLKQN